MKASQPIRRALHRQPRQPSPSLCAADAGPTNFASPRRLAAMGLFAALLALVGCDQQKVDEAMKKAGDTARNTWNAIKPDSELFKGIAPGQSTEEHLRRPA